MANLLIASPLGHVIERKTYFPDAKIFREGEPGDTAYIIERGEVDITVLHSGREVVLATLADGDLFGEMALIDNAVRTATAVARGHTDLVVISRAYFHERMHGADPLLNLFMRVVLQRFRRAQRAVFGGDAPDSESRPSLPEATQAFFARERERAMQNLRFQEDLERALGSGELTLVYQPIVAMATDALVGCEALMRWQHPVRGFVSPVNFIGFAETCGLIVPMGHWALREARRTLSEMTWVRGDESAPLFMSVNISGRQLRDPAAVRALADVVSGSELPPSSTRLEVTESLLMDDPVVAERALNELKEAGAHLAIDDFGTGYSSLGYLHRFPIDTLKIDRSFISSMLSEQASMKIVRAVTGLSHDLDLAIVAEGVETESQRLRLAELDCQFGQGYLFSKPVSRDDMIALASDRHSVLPPSIGLAER